MRTGRAALTGFVLAATAVLGGLWAAPLPVAAWPRDTGIQAAGPPNGGGARRTTGNRTSPRIPRHRGSTR